MQRAPGSCTVPASFPHPSAQARPSPSDPAPRSIVQSGNGTGAHGVLAAQAGQALDEAGQSLAALVVVLVIAGVPRSSSRVASKLRSRLCNSAA